MLSSIWAELYALAFPIASVNGDMTQRPIDPDNIPNVVWITVVAGVQDAAAERKYASARLDVSALKATRPVLCCMVCPRPRRGTSRLDPRAVPGLGR
jgi:hypothetical protein